MLPRFCLLLAGVLATQACPGAAPAAFREDRILIQPKAGVGAAALGQFHAAQKSRPLRTFHGARGLQVVQVPAGAGVAQFVAKCRRSGLVEFAEPDYAGQVFATVPNDPKFADGTLWGLHTNNAPAAWDVQASASHIVVALLDTGVRHTHEDLAANMWANPLDGSRGWNAINNNNDPSDFGTHGTMMAGALGAVGNNGRGVCGVAWRLQIQAGACFNGSGIGNISDVITCLEFARTNGARIINASWGFTNSLALSNAMVRLRDAGILVVAASGNSAADIDVSPTFPASYALDNIVTVTATSRADALSSFASYGATHVDLAAPGEQIYSTFPATDTYYYGDMQGGTSYSAAQVSGACALLMAQYPADDYRQIIARLLAGTDPLPSLAGKCRTGGRLNLQKILRTVLVSPQTSAGATPLSLRVSGGINRTCVVETATELTSWSPILTNSTDTNGVFHFSDSALGSAPARFFRARSNP